MKTYLTILLFLLILPFSVFAATVDLSGAMSLKVAGITVVLQGVANSVVTSSDSGDTFTVTLGDGLLTITSSDKKITSASVPSSSSYVVESSCGTDSSYITIRGVVDTSITVTPLTSACSSGGGGGGVVSGGGGSSSGFAPSVPSQSAAPAPATAPAIATTPAPVVAAPSVIVAPAAAVSVPISVSVSPVFTKTLKLGTTNSDVKRLQQVLNSDPDTKIVSTGVGSPGRETNYFGAFTREALKKFQCKHKIICSGTPSTTGYGNLGPKTRIKIKEIFTQTESPAVAPQAVQETAPVVVPVTPAPAPVTPTPQPTTPSTQTEEVPWFLKLTPAPTPQ